MVATTRAAASARQSPRPRPKPKAKAKTGRNGRPSRKRSRHGLTTLRGILWAVLLFAAAEGGPVAIAVLMMVVAGIAGASGVRASGGLAIGAPAKAPAAVSSVPPYLGLAVAAAILVPAAALGGAVAAMVVAVLVAALAVVIVLSSPGARIPYRTLLAAMAPAVAAASTVLAARQGLTELATLLVAVCLFDAANFLTGNGRSGWPIGSICGALTVGVFAVLVAAVVVPPFSGHKPWILLGLVAGLAPAGVILSGMVSARHPVPALRRLDSLVLAAPAWAIGVALLLHR